MIKRLKIAKREVPIGKNGICLLGDSNTQISYFNDYPYLRWSQIISTDLNKEVINLGENGARTSDLIVSGEEIEPVNRFLGEDVWRQTYAKYFIICFGLNDASYYNTTLFNKYTNELIDKIRSLHGVPILMTNVWVDYPDHYTTDRNTVIKQYDDIKRNIADNNNIHLIDVYQRFKAEYTNNGIWDTRIRTTDIWDDSQDAGKTVGSGWFNNIHYNVKGNEIVADEITKYFQANNL